MDNVCNACGEPTDMQCTGCEAVFYCDTKCQRADRSAHHELCAFIGALELEDYRPETGLRRLRIESLARAVDLLKELNSQQANVVTVESLTAGMMAKTLVDIPTFGSYIYGGFVVHDSDAKREMLDANEPDVYTSTMAEEMARGALKNSRAILSIAVTGRAGPAITEPDVPFVGIVDIGIGIATEDPDSPRIMSTRINATKDAYINTLYIQYQKEFNADAGNGLSSFHKKQATLHTTSELRDAIRLFTTARAFAIAQNELNDHFAGKAKLPLRQRDTQREYNDVGEPSWVIEKYLRKSS